MSRTFKFGILRARHDNTTPYVTDEVCQEMLISNAGNTGILQYWTYNTNGYLSLSADFLPWVDISLTWPIVNDRRAHAQAVYDATIALNKISSGYDGFIILELPGGSVTVPNPQAGMPGQPPTITRTFDAGATSLANGKGAAVLPIMTSDHTFMCHEVGHVLGFVHTYGVLNNGIDWDGLPPWDEGNVYGDPYDIMSSATFGTRQLDPAVVHWQGSPTFSGPAISNWPNAGAFSMGPAPARAHVHFWDEAAFSGAGRTPCSGT